MNDPLVAGAYLDGFQPADAIDRGSKDEVPIHVGAGGWQRVRLFGFDNFVRLAELPSWDKLRCGRQIMRGTFNCSLVNPFLNEGYLVVQQTKLIGEFQLLRFRQPRRHVTPGRYVSNLTGPRLRVRIGKQGKWTGFARMVADGTRMKEDWRDVTIESNLRNG